MAFTHVTSITLGTDGYIGMEIVLFFSLEHLNGILLRKCYELMMRRFAVPGLHTSTYTCIRNKYLVNHCFVTCIEVEKVVDCQ